MTDVAVIGIGSWGQNLVRTFDGLATVRWACHTGSGANADWLDEQFPDVQRTTDYDAVLADEAVDAVVVATPIPTLADVAERALRAGKHVYVEKPMAPSQADAERLATLAEERGLTLFVGYIFVHHPIFVRARERMSAEGAEHLRLAWRAEGSFEPDLLLNLACHPISIAVAALGRPESVSVSDRREATGGTDLVACRLSYPAVDCEVLVNRLSPEKGYAMTAVTEAGGVYVATDDALYEFDREAAGFGTAFDGDVDPLGAECEHFLEAVETGAEPATDGAFAVAVHEVLSAVRAEF